MFFSNINFWTNLFALLGQMFIVKQIVGRFGIGRSLALLPLVSIAGFILLAIDPVLGVARCGGNPAHRLLVVRKVRHDEAKVVAEGPSFPPQLFAAYMVWP